MARFNVFWKVPKVLPYVAALVPEMPVTCRKISRRTIISSSDGYSHQQTYKCDSLEGEILGLHYPQHNPGLSAVFHISLADGQVHTSVLGPDKNNWIVPSTPSILTIVHSYLVLGIDHILAGGGSSVICSSACIYSQPSLPITRCSHGLYTGTFNNTKFCSFRNRLSSSSSRGGIYCAQYNVACQRNHMRKFRFSNL